MKAAIVLMAGAFVIAHAAAQNYPSKPIRLIVPFASGGGGDGALRPLAPGMSVQVEIHTGSRRVIDYFLSPLRGAVRDSLRER